tara:strand:+ start:152 stop:985 length:834 start_codon:yes stop_codon:yes gene_type:complete
MGSICEDAPNMFNLIKIKIENMSKIAVIDADSLIYYEMGKPTLEEAMESLDMRIRQIINFAEAEFFIGFLTLGKCFRYGIAKTKPYKYNRKGGTPKPPIFYALKEYIQQKWGFYGVPGLEADDLVAIFRNEFQDSVICSPDKDVLEQLVGRHFNYGKQEFVNTTEQEADEFLVKQVLMGDSTDGIPGIPKVGKKTAEKWIDQANYDIECIRGMAFRKYMEKFGYAEGILKFAETFSLVYLLRTKQEAYNMGILESELVFRVTDIQNFNKTDDEDEEW